MTVSLQTGVKLDRDVSLVVDFSERGRKFYRAAELLADMLILLLKVFTLIFWGSLLISYNPYVRVGTQWRITSSSYWKDVSLLTGPNFGHETETIGERHLRVQTSRWFQQQDRMKLYESQTHNLTCPFNGDVSSTTEGGASERRSAFVIQHKFKDGLPTTLIFQGKERRWFENRTFAHDFEIINTRAILGKGVITRRIHQQFDHQKPPAATLTAIVIYQPVEQKWAIFCFINWILDLIKYITKCVIFPLHHFVVGWTLNLAMAIETFGGLHETAERLRLWADEVTVFEISFPVIGFIGLICVLILLKAHFRKFPKVYGPHRLYAWDSVLIKAYEFQAKMIRLARQPLVLAFRDLKRRKITHDTRIAELEKISNHSTPTNGCTSARKQLSNGDRRESKAAADEIIQHVLNLVMNEVFVCSNIQTNIRPTKNIKRGEQPTACTLNRAELSVVNGNDVEMIRSIVEKFQMENNTMLSLKRDNDAVFERELAEHDAEIPRLEKDADDSEEVEKHSCSFQSLLASAEKQFELDKMVLEEGKRMVERDCFNTQERTRKAEEARDQGIHEVQTLLQLLPLHLQSKYDISQGNTNEIFDFQDAGGQGGILNFQPKTVSTLM